MVILWYPHHFYLIAAIQLQNAEVFIGSCQGSAANIALNTRCDTPISLTEAVSNSPILSKCPADSYGQFIYITVPGYNKQVVLCEVKVYGRKGESYNASHTR